MSYARHQKPASSGSEPHGKHETTLHQKGMQTRNPAAPSEKPKGGSVSADATRNEVAKSHSITDGRVA